MRTRNALALALLALPALAGCASSSASSSCASTTVTAAQTHHGQVFASDMVQPDAPRTVRLWSADAAGLALYDRARSSQLIYARARPAPANEAYATAPGQ